MILALYADDSSDRKGENLLCAGALFGWPHDIFEIERKWQMRLDRDGIKYFRSYDCDALEGEFGIPKHRNLNTARAVADSVRHDLTEILLSGKAAGALSVSLLLKDFENLVANNPQARDYFGVNAATVTYKILIRDVITRLTQDWPEDATPIAFTFDNHTKFLEAEEAYRDLRRDSLFAERMGYVGHADDKKHPPLQMADLIASVARKQTLEWLKDKRVQLPRFKAFTEVNRFYFAGVLGEKELLADLKWHLDHGQK